MNNLKKWRVSTSMGIALTLLAGGIVTQLTDTLELFGKNSAIPLFIGLGIIAVGVSFFLLKRWLAKSRTM